MKIVLTRDAATDFEAIVEFGLEQFGEIQTQKYQELIQSKIRNLPSSWTARPRPTGSHLLFRENVGRHCIFFRRSVELIEVLMIIDQCADLPARLSRRINDV